MRAWQGNWRARVLERVRQHGYRSAAEFVEAHPKATFIELAHILGDGDVAAVQLEDVMRDEAGNDPLAFEKFARNLLARNIFRVMPQGWAEEGFARVFGHWSGYLSEGYDGATDRVFDALVALAPKGWRPTGPDDPLLLEAFKRWPG